MVEPLRHRQTKGAATDMFYLMPPRHISTLPFSTEMACPCHVCFPPDSDHSADIWGGPFRAISELGPALFNRFGSAHRAPGSIDTPGLLTHP